LDLVLIEKEQRQTTNVLKINNQRINAYVPSEKSQLQRT